MSRLFKKAKHDDPLKTTYQARIREFKDLTYEQGIACLSEYATSNGHISRTLFAKIMSGKTARELRSIFPKNYGISTRQYDSITSLIEGKISAVKTSQKNQVENLETRIKKAKQEIKDLNAKDGKDFQIHNKKRRLYILETKCDQLNQDIEDNKVRIAFGSKKLWHKQYNLELNGYKDHEDWLEDWQFNRDSEIFIMGERTKPGGNSECQAKVNENGNLDIKLRLPYNLEHKYGKHLVMLDVNFNHGHDHILAALSSCEDYKAYAKEHGKKVKETDLGQALTYLFKLDHDKKDNIISTVFVTTDMLSVPLITSKKNGTIGIDINIDHLAVTEVDKHGNFVNTFSVPLILYGKSTNQAKDLINLAAIKITKYAKEKKKSLVLEKLDFTKKKAELEGQSKKQKRMLSSFAYSKIITSIKSRAYKEGVYVHSINPCLFYSNRHI